MDLLPRQPQPAKGTTSGSGQGGSSRPAMYEGAEVTTVSDERPRPSTSGNGFDLNFENSPVVTVAKVVLGDILGVGYTIDPRVQGTVSLVSVRPVAKSDIIFVLENALRLSGVVLVRDTAGYRLSPLGDAVGAGTRRCGRRQPRTRLRRVRRAAAICIGADAVEADGQLCHQGRHGSCRRDAKSAVYSGHRCRTPHRRGHRARASTSTGCAVNRSGFFRSRSGSPAPIIAELEKIVDSGENGLSQNVIKFQPIVRLNAIMVVSQEAGDVAHGGDLDQAARSCRHRENNRSRLSGQIR